MRSTMWSHCNSKLLCGTLKPNYNSLFDGVKNLLVWSINEKRKYNFEKKFNRYNQKDYYADRRTDSFTKSRDLLDVKTIDWEKVNLKVFNKTFYTPHPNILSRLETETNDFFKKNQIKIIGTDCPAPILNLEESGFSEEIINLMWKFQYTEPTPIQSVGWPIALSGRDVVGIARTGSGKTLSYILPALVHIQHQPELLESEGPVALVLAPTRELVQQINHVTFPFVRAFGMRSAVVYGGSGRTFQANELKKRVEVCIATPGRLLDFLSHNEVTLNRCTYLVLDEADRMFDMGFEPQIRSIIKQIRPDRQVLMWSATWPIEIKRLVNEYLKNYLQIRVGSLKLMANPNIKQIIHICNENEKKSLLKKIMENIFDSDKNDRKTLIFASTKHRVDELKFWLNSNNYESEAMHSGKSQRARENIFRAFQKGYVSVLVATDIAARGLDVSDIQYVINFDFPNTIEDYIHRIGRTARHNNSGIAHTFFTSAEVNQASSLISVLNDAKQEVSPELQEMVRYKEKFNFSKKF